MSTPDIRYTPHPDGKSMLRIEERPNGPLIIIGADGSISLNREPDEAAQLFWDAVAVNGLTYRERISMLESQLQQVMQANQALACDPFRDVIHGSAERVYQAMSSADRKVISRYNVQTILDTINKLACEAVQ